MAQGCFGFRIVVEQLRASQLLQRFRNDDPARTAAMWL